MINQLDPFFPPAEPDDRSGHLHRQMIGYLGMVLPILLCVIAGLRPTEGLKEWKLLDSISSYYYTAAVAAFSGILVALAVFIFTYRGYENERRRRDRIAAVIAGVAAILVATFPTAAPGGVLPPS